MVQDRAVHEIEVVENNFWRTEYKTGMCFRRLMRRFCVLICLYCQTVGAATANTRCKTTDWRNKCLCEYGQTDPRCMQCKNRFDKTCTGAESCWDITQNDPMCVRKYMRNGQLYSIPDEYNCCSNATLVPYDSLDRIQSVGGATFTKDDVARKFVLYSAAYAPTVNFPGLLASAGTLPYDNTTCSGRCCRRALLRSDPAGCADDWKKCSVEFGAERRVLCVDGNGTLPCDVWVPCDANERLDVIVAVSILGVISLGLIAVEVWCVLFGDKVYGYDGLHGVLVVVYVLFFGQCLVNSFSLMVASDFAHWKASNDVSLEYTSYQSCAQYCNEDSDPLVVRDKFCSDSFYENEFALWEANRNPVKYTGSRACSGSNDLLYTYCKKCDEHKNDWKILDVDMEYLKVRALLTWIVSILFLGLQWFPSLGWQYGTGCLGAVLLMLHFVFLIISSVAFNDITQVRGGLRLMGQYSNTLQAEHLSVSGVLAACVAFDVMLFLCWFYVLAYMVFIADNHIADDHRPEGFRFSWSKTHNPVVAPPVDSATPPPPIVASRPSTPLPERGGAGETSKVVGVSGHFFGTRISALMSGQANTYPNVRALKTRDFFKQI